MPTPFDDWDLEDARAAVQLEADRAEQIQRYFNYINGDHFQQWWGWIGPAPAATDENAVAVRQAIETGFISRNALGEGVGRHVNGVLGRDVKWNPVPRRPLKKDEQPKAEEQALIDELKPLLEAWIEARKLNQEYDKAGETLLVTGTAYQRLFVAPGEVRQDGTVPSDEMGASLGRIYVHFPLPGEAFLWTDQRTQRKCSIYFYKEETSSRPSQRQDNGQERAELCYIDDSGNTIIRIIGPEGDIKQTDAAYSYQLGNRLIMADMQRKPLLNPQVVSQQKLLNLALTMKERNVILGGFLERVAINAQMDGSYVEVDGVKRFVPNALPVGSGALTSLTGYITYDKDGKETLATPNMLWRDPVDVKTFLDTENSSYKHILAEFNQLHYGAASDSGISAESRMVSMAAYVIDLLTTKQQVDSGFAWLLESAAALAAILSGQPGRYDSLRISAECSIDPGPITADMMRIAQELAGGQQLLAAKTARNWIGVEDAEAEANQIAQELEEMGANFDLAAVQSQIDEVRGAGAGGSNGASNAARSNNNLPAQQRQAA